MAGQIGEFITSDPVSEWVDLSEVAYWFGSEEGFEEGKVYSIFNNSSVSFRFISTDDLDEEAFGTYVPQGSIVYFRPNDGEKLYVQGEAFNIAISRIK